MNCKPHHIKPHQILRFRNNLSNYYVVLKNNHHEQIIDIQLCYPELPTQRRDQISQISYQEFFQKRPQVTEANDTMILCYRCEGRNRGIHSHFCQSCQGLGTIPIKSLFK